MIDIVILALPTDEARAGAILDALKSRGAAGKYRTRFVAAHPADPDWRAAKERVAGIDCAVFAFSAATGGQDCVPYRNLALAAHKAGRVIAVELDPGALPAEMAGCSTYPLDGPRANPAWWFRALFGNPYKNLIVAAATDKAEGRDPPSPAAVRTVAVKQFGLRLLGLGTVIGLISSVIGIGGTETVQKWWHADQGRAFAEAKAKGCPGVREFGTNNAGTPWQSEVTAYLAGCPAAEKVVDSEQRQGLEIDITKPEAGTHRGEVQARLASAGVARDKARAMCDFYYKHLGGRVQSVQLEQVTHSCGPQAGGSACSTHAMALCNIVMPQMTPDQRLP